MVAKNTKGGLGFVGALVIILEIVALIVVKVFSITYYIFKYLLAICPNPDGDVFTGTCFIGGPRIGI